MRQGPEGPKRPKSGLNFELDVRIEFSSQRKKKAISELRMKKSID